MNTMEEKSWMSEKKLLVTSADYGRDLTGLGSHKPRSSQSPNNCQSRDRRKQQLLAVPDLGVAKGNSGGPDLGDNMTAVLKRLEVISLILFLVLFLLHL